MFQSSLIQVFIGPECKVFTQTVRFRRLPIRKPVWMPMAKSKMFKIPPRPVIPEEDKLELARLHNNYRTQIRSIRRFLFDEQSRERLSLENVLSAKSLEEEAHEFERCMRENDLWNAEVAATRNKRLEEEGKLREEQILRIMSRRDEISEKFVQEADEKIRMFKEQSKTFITPEMLDEVIEKSLESVVDYNFAIDLEGTIYPGRESTTALQEESNAEAFS